MSSPNSPNHPNHAPAPDPTAGTSGSTATPDPAERAGRACRALLDAARRFAAGTAEARRDLENRRTDAERVRREAHARSVHEREQALAAADRTREETLERERHRYEERLQRIDRELETARKEAIDRAEQSEEETRKLLADAVWLADSVHESGLERNQRDVESVRERIAEARAVLEELQARVRLHLRRCRQAEPRVVPDEAQVSRGARGAMGAIAVPVALLDLRKHAEAIETLTLPLVFRNVFPLLLLLPGAAIGATAMAFRNAGDGLAIGLGAAAGVGISTLLLAIAYLVARRQIRRVHRAFAAAAAVIDRSAEVAIKDAAEARKRADATLDATLAEETAQAKATYEPVLSEIVQKRDARLASLDELRPKYREKAERDRDEAIDTSEREASEARESAERRHAGETREIDATRDGTLADASLDHERRTAAEQEAWAQASRRFDEERAALAAIATPRAVPWADRSWTSWEPATAPGLPISVGRVRFDPTAHLADLDHAADLPSPLPEAVDLPLLLDLPARRGLLIEADAPQRDLGLAALQAAVLRILTTLPAGKVRLTLVDPVGLGANFAGFMHLADEDQQLVGDRIWTEPRHIEQRLTDLTEHMETVIQKYLRNEFESIDAYNEKAGEIAEPYRVLVVADLPANLTETAAKRLASILESGARCGVLTVMLRDLRAELPPTLKAEDLARGVVRFAPQESGQLAVMTSGLDALPLALDEAPPADLLQSLAGRIGSSARDASRVEVPFEAIAPTGDDRWSMDSGSKLAVSLGRAGATRLQQLVLGMGTAQHVLIAGKTGSGKSTLLHAMISNLCAWYGPDQVQLYLVDFKKGVEFKTYATHRLPHVKAVAVESDREFGLSVLQGLDAELKRRGDLFRAAGTQDLKGFR
ncbi:MAG: FtsK/SpoIIIE domain-containing protein, partial [Planctomycetota bacterium]